jgi:hypothetical protein
MTAGYRLPILRLRLLPDLRCTCCGALGYVEEKTGQCGACWNISLLRFAARRRRHADGAAAAAERQMRQAIAVRLSEAWERVRARAAGYSEAANVATPPGVVAPAPLGTCEAAGMIVAVRIVLALVVLAVIAIAVLISFAGGDQ